MARTVRAALIQAHANLPKQEALDKHVAMVEEAASQGAEVVCLQEIFFGPYFCAQQEPKWFETAEPDDGPTVQAMRELARKHSLVLVVPFFEKEFEGVFYNTAVVIDADGEVLGKYRKTHIPQVGPIFWEKYFFKPGNLGYPVFDTRVGRVGVFICYDRHFPEPARILGLQGAQLTFNPSATIESLSRHLWQLEQPAHAVANGFFVGAVNRVGEELVEGARFYGSSYFCDPRGQIIAQASDTDDEVLIANLDLAMIDEVRTTWQFFRDRRPETYGPLVEMIP
ncbi:MAG: nitrilase-related carbon-nitrogen hydrolase [Gaiellaceae bacterium]